jgi:DNA-binding transcriptional ArsR family regulator/uncharacterized coiled-coil protein SlyX
MASNNEEPYSTIFASLKHPIRRRILRMLSNQPMSFSEMIEVLGVSNSFLTYHLENLGELISKTKEGKYKLSSFGEAANATMMKVEDIPASVPHHSPRIKIRGFRGRTATLALGIICILLIAGLSGTIAYYTMAINNRQSELDSANKTINQLNATTAKQNDAIGQLNTTISNLQNQITSLTSLVSSLKSLLHATPTTVNELDNDTSDWVNRTVVLEGNLDGPLFTPGDENLPYGYELTSDNQTIGLTFNVNVNLTSFYGNQYQDVATVNLTDHSVGSTRVYFLNSSITVRIYGVVKQGVTTFGWNMPSQVTYYIEAEEVEMA